MTPKLKTHTEMSAEEEKRLLREGTDDAREKVIEALLPKAVEHVKAACRNRLTVTEQWSIAGLVLLECVKRCNPERGRLLTFARRYLKGAVRRAWREREPVDYGERLPETSLLSREEIEQLLEMPLREDLLSDWIHFSERLEHIQPLLERLSERERLVLDLHYRLGLGFRVIGRYYLNLTRGGTHLIHQQALKKIRHWLLEAKIYTELKEAA